MFLDVSRNAVKMLGSLEPRQLTPRFKSLMSGLHSRVDVLASSLGRGGQDSARGRTLGLVGPPSFRMLPRVVDKESELPVVVLQPILGNFVRLWGGSVLHGLEYILH